LQLVRATRTTETVYPCIICVEMWVEVPHFDETQ